MHFQYLEGIDRDQFKVFFSYLNKNPISKTKVTHLTLTKILQSPTPCKLGIAHLVG